MADKDWEVVNELGCVMPAIGSREHERFSKELADMWTLPRYLPPVQPLPLWRRVLLAAVGWLRSLTDLR